MPDNAYFSIGFGDSMYNTDMLAWFSDNGTGSVVDYYSEGEFTPSEDITQNFSEGLANAFDSTTKRMTFVTRRPLDTSDLDGDFVVKLNTAMPMIWAYQSKRSSWSFHEKTGRWNLYIGVDTKEKSGREEGESSDDEDELTCFDTIEVDTNGTTVLDINDNPAIAAKCSLPGIPKYIQHGWWMWSVWFVVALLLLTTKRYFKKYWFVMHNLHAFLGWFTMACTVAFALKVTHWNPFENLHTALGTLSVLVTIFVWFMGVFTAGTMKAYRGDKPWTEKERVERIAKIHRISGYFVILIGNVAIATGVGTYYKDKLDEDDRWIQGPISLWTFILIVIILETTYRCRNKFSLGHVKTPAEGVKESFTPDKVDEEVAKGRSLVIFDNLVLDINGY